MSRKTSSKTARKDRQESGIVVGQVNGIGNVVGNGSHSQVEIQVSAPPEARKDAPGKAGMSRHSALWARLLAFLLAFSGALAAIALFNQLLSVRDGWTLVQLVLAALGVAGFLRPQALAQLLARLFGR